MNLEIALMLAYLGLASVLFALITWRRLFRSSPLFFAYMCFDLVSTTVAQTLYHNYGPSAWYLRFLLSFFVVEFLLYLCVLAEIGKNLLGFNRKSLPRWNLAILLFVASAALMAGLSGWAFTPSRSLLGNICFVEMRANVALEFAGFLALATWSSLRKLHWPERELRIANGFGFITFAWFLISLLEFRWSTGPVFSWSYQTGQAANLVLVAYWLHYFWLVERGAPARNALAEPDLDRDRNDAHRTPCLKNA